MLISFSLALCWQHFFYFSCTSSDNSEEEEEKYYHPNGLNSAPSDSGLEEIKTEESIKMATSCCIHNDQRGDQMNLKESKNGEKTKGKKQRLKWRG